MVESPTYDNVKTNICGPFWAISNISPLRLALTFVFESFIHNQLLEDCEFASATPGESILKGLKGFFPCSRVVEKKWSGNPKEKDGPMAPNVQAAAPFLLCMM